MPSRNDGTGKHGEKRDGRTEKNRAAPEDAQPRDDAPPAPARKKRVTLTDIARRAGVSPAAVSFTLAERLDIPLAAATRKWIKQCARELGYVPNRLSEGFFHGRSKLIGILIVADSYRPFLACIAGIHAGLAETDCFPLLMSPDWMEGHRHSGRAGDQDHNELADLRRLLEYQVDGVLYFSLSTHLAHAVACVRELADRKIPMVILGGVDPSGGAVDTVGGDNEKIGWMAAEHLLSVGCASFVIGKPARSHPLDNAVHESFAARLKSAGQACREFALDMENPGDLGSLLSRLVRPPAGIFCTRDDIAALALRAALALGWWVPRDAAVMTMGGESSLSQLNALPITTVERHSFAAGEAAAKLLIRRIDGFSGRPQRILIPPSLEARASSMSDVSWQLRSNPSPPDAPHPRPKKRARP